MWFRLISLLLLVLLLLTDSLRAETSHLGNTQSRPPIGALGTKSNLTDIISACLVGRGAVPRLNPPLIVPAQPIVPSVIPLGTPPVQNGRGAQGQGADPGQALPAGDKPPEIIDPNKVVDPTVKTQGEQSRNSSPDTKNTVASSSNPKPTENVPSKNVAKNNEGEGTKPLDAEVIVTVDENGTKRRLWGKRVAGLTEVRIKDKWICT